MSDERRWTDKDQRKAEERAAELAEPRLIATICLLHDREVCVDRVWPSPERT